MKMKNVEIVMILNSLGSFNEKKLPQKISYAITKNNMILAKEYEVYVKELEKLNAEYNEYMIKDENGELELNPSGIPKVKSEVEEEYYGKINELLNIEIEVNIYTIDEECFDYDDIKGKYDSLSVSEQMMLRALLTKIEK